MATVGKKKKVVYRSKKQKSLLIPALILGGLAFWYFTKKKDETATQPDYVEPENLSDAGTLDTGIIVNNPVPPPVVVAPPVADDPFVVAPEMKLYTKNDFYNYMNEPIKKAHGYKSLDIRNHSLTALQIMYALSKYIPFSSTDYWRAFDSMTDQQLQNVWQYVNLYLSKNKILQYSSDPVLYNALAVLKTKYGIF